MSPETLARLLGTMRARVEPGPEWFHALIWTTFRPSSAVHASWRALGVELWDVGPVREDVPAQAAAIPPRFGRTGS